MNIDIVAKSRMPPWRNQIMADIRKQDTYLTNNRTGKINLN